MNIQKVGIIQKPVYFQNRQISVKQNQSSAYLDNSSVLNALSFLGNYNKPSLKEAIDVPIKDDKEFNKVMKRVYREKIKPENKLQALNPFRNRVWISKNYKKEFDDYKNATDVEMGLIPYCGWNDNSLAINMFLSERLTENGPLDEYVREPKHFNSCVDVVRALDYSLNNLDKEFGKYDGIVYRIGYMSEEGKQYFSTSKSFVVADRRRQSQFSFDKGRGYSVIRLKNGHKIYDFQKKMGCRFSETEEEVLTDRHSKFRKLKPEEYDEELIQARENLAKRLFWGAADVIDGQKSDFIKWDRDEILNFIDVYEEI